MQPFDKIKQYTNSVCNQIRWKKAHSVIAEEIENHIIDQKDAFIATGLGESTSIEKAIEQMGDPITVGSQLDRTHRPKTEWSMILLTIALLMIGLIIRFFVKNNQPNTSELYFFYKSVIVTIMGIICMVIAYFIDFTIIGKYPKIIFTLITVLILIVHPFANIVNGARYFNIPFIGTMNISFIILLLPIAYAGIIYSMRNKGYLGIILCGIFHVIPAIIFLYIGQSTSGVFLYSLSCFILLAASIGKGWFNINRLKGLSMVFVPTVVVFIFLILTLFAQTYRSTRFQAWLNPYIDPTGWGYMPTIIRDILSGAKLFGQGTLTVKYTEDISIWLPSINTDYLITYLTHRIGWIALIIILTVFVIFIIRGFYLCSKQKSILGKLVSMSVMIILTAQVVIYLSANLGFQFFSQIALPLISYGGTAVSINLILIGIMLSTFRTGDLLRDKKRLPKRMNKKIFKFADGKIIINLGIK